MQTRYLGARLNAMLGSSGPLRFIAYADYVVSNLPNARVERRAQRYVSPSHRGFSRVRSNALLGVNFYDPGFIPLASITAAAAGVLR